MGSLSGGLCLGGLCPGSYLCRVEEVEEWAVSILLEYILVIPVFSINGLGIESMIFQR